MTQRSYEDLSLEDLTGCLDKARDLVELTGSRLDPVEARACVESVFPGDTPNTVLRTVIQAAMNEANDPEDI